jgi:tRNA wybutosine-synthesizing protein 3
MTSRFAVRKQNILKQLEVPDGDYTDLSPKGSVDEPIRGLISEINALDGLVTTSSCSGRISVFLEGRKATNDDVSAKDAQESRAGPGGKGGGGSWLFISHAPLEESQLSSTEPLIPRFGLEDTASEDASGPSVQSRYIHLKFEPMVRSFIACAHRN